jgi:hypothetical protein
MLPSQVASNLLPRLFAFGVVATHIGSQVAVATESLASEENQKTAARVAQSFFAAVTFTTVLALHHVSLPVIAITALASFAALIVPLINMDQDLHELSTLQKEALFIANIVLDILTKVTNIAIFAASLNLAHISVNVILLTCIGLGALNLVPTLKETFK